ncbi:MAG TPA: AMP-binding protein, partial [Planococcus sp. (in: firmicutes)]|nr:AMP-binding protein [Planococcus sp. (in: firmicutes)]
MNTAHFEFWPQRVSKTLTIPETTLFDNLLVTAKRYPDKEALVYYGARYTYRELLAEVESLAGYLEHEMKVASGERVLLFMQNSPQFLIGYYAILRVRGIVVPINPMSTAEELGFYIQDGEIRTGIVGQELMGQIVNLRKAASLANVLVAAYSDYAGT